MYCKKCGAALQDGQKFCTKCGTAVNVSNESVDNAFDNGAADAYVPSYAPVSAPAVQRKPVNTKKVKTIAITVLILAIIAAVGITVLKSTAPTREMNAALNGKTASEVNYLYSSENDSRAIEKYDKAINRFLISATDDINAQTFSDDDAVYNYIKEEYGDLIDSEDGESIDPSISDYNAAEWENLQNMYSSKINYYRGISSLEDEEPEAAIDYFQKVIDADECYSQVQDELSKCVDLYVKQTLEEAENLIADGNITEALDTINQINDYLDEKGLTSDEVQNKLTETKNSYANSYVKKAEECFNAKDADGAIGNMDVAVELCPDNEEYKSKKAEYESYVPFYLYIEDNCLSTENEDDFWGILRFNKKPASNNNKDMFNSIEWYNNNTEGANASAAVNYNLDGKYDTVSGTLFLDKNSKDSESKGYFKAYGDGKLIYTSPKMTKDVLPKDISFSVKDVHKLKIKFYSKEAGGSIVSAYFGVSGLTAQKDFPKK
ncbi:MAG: NPCBM/NEW2 domain-containing protein [Clostridia bacterium]|nr:NPCBM/NEW2 domain-containing protein [Clostridia bacterium]